MDDTPIDVFLDYAPIHAAAAQNVWRVRLSGVESPVLGPEHAARRVNVTRADRSSRRSAIGRLIRVSFEDYNRKIIEEFRANAGRPPSWTGSSPLLLVHHRGARSGTARVNPVAYLEDGGRYLIFASKAGAPSHPAWYHNLKAHPHTTIEVGSDTVEVTVEEVTGAERDRLFAMQAERSPQFAQYQAKTDRAIPILALTPR